VKRIGAALMAIGILSLPMMLIGLQFSWLSWIDSRGLPLGILGRLSVIGLGFLIFKKSDD
jgi:uncharacterized protein (DUF3820 family)